MKKIFLSLIISLFCISAVSAQHYRGFLDVTASISTKINNHNIGYEVSPGLALEFTTSHGLQLNNFFIGTGFGYTAFPSSCWQGGFPVFIDGRYDFFNDNSTNFFIACKLGYCIPVFEVWFNEDNYWYTDSELKGLFFNPSIGVRFRLTDIIGINLALGYSPQKFEISEIEQKHENRINLGDKFIDNRIILSFGIDF